MPLDGEDDYEADLDVLQEWSSVGGRFALTPGRTAQRERPRSDAPMHATENGDAVNVGPRFHAGARRVFSYRALDGRGLVHALDRPLHAFVGLWMLVRELVFTHALLSDPTARLLYREGNGDSAMTRYSASFFRVSR